MQPSSSVTARSRTNHRSVVTARARGRARPCVLYLEFPFSSWAERFQTSSFLCTYKLCDYYSPILLSFLHHSYMWPFSICKIFSFTCTLLALWLQQTSTVAKVRVIIICYTGNPGVVDACDRSLSPKMCLQLPAYGGNGQINCVGGWLNYCILAWYPVYFSNLLNLLIRSVRDKCHC